MSTRTFTGTADDGRRVLVTIYDPNDATRSLPASGEVAYREGGRWGVPTTITEERS